MSEKSAHDRSAVAAALRRSRRLLVTTHVRADGDALGSMLALHAAARLAGKACQMILAEELGRRYRFLFRDDQPTCLSDPKQAGRQFAELADRVDTIVVVDTSSYEQLVPIAQALNERRRKVVVIDHHATADDAGEVAWRDPEAAASGVMVAELLEELSWPLDLAGVDALAAAILTDTGWLRYANTDARAARVLAALLSAGAKADVLYAKVHQNDRPQRVHLLAAALSSLQLHAGDRLAMMTLTRGDFARTGAGEDQTEDFVNEPQRIGSVEIAALLTELPDGIVRGSLRSRSTVDVAAIAGRFGGGGHVRAAGFRIAGDLESVRQRLLAECLAALKTRD